MNFHEDGYEAPASTNENYFKPKDGSNRVRVLSSPITGWQEFVDNHPVRSKGKEKPANMGPDTKFFWAMLIWDYEDRKIKIWNCDKRSIQKSIDALVENPTWGSPFYYDLIITRTGTDNRTRYTVMPNPHNQVDKSVEQAFWSKPCFLGKIWTGEDPWASYAGTPTQGVFGTRPVSVVPQEKPKNMATNAQLMELEDLIVDCAPGYSDEVLAKLRKAPYNAQRFEDVTSEVMAKIIEKTKLAKDEYQAILAGQSEEVPF